MSELLREEREALPFEKAKWIWIEGDPMPRNLHVRMRKSFRLDAQPSSAWIHVSADSRYWLFVNGTAVGNGPTRSFPHRQQYDSYEVSGLLRAGENVISCRVHHYGESTFQYVQGRGGLLLEFASDNLRFGTDSTWKASKDPAFEVRTPRISCQMPYEEQYDARNEEPWHAVEFSDAAWTAAVEIGPAGTEPWTGMEGRTVPQFSRIPHLPVAVTSSRRVRPVALREAVNVRKPLFPEDRTANRMEYRALISTMIYSNADQDALLVRQFSLYLGEWRLNGEAVKPPVKGETPVRLRKGANFFTAELIGECHEQYFTLFLDAEKAVHIGAPFAEGPKWLIAGPLDDDIPTAQAAARSVRGPEDLEQLRDRFLYSVPERDEVEADVWNTVYSQRTLPGEAELKNPDALLAEDDSAMELSAAGGDVEFILDFGKELLGHSSFRIDAPEGTVIDFAFFEAVLEDGPQHMYGNRASFRYICREGLQSYETEWRRGFRFASVTVRNASRPVRFFHIGTVFSAYPAEPRGSFRCSDELLNRIWDVGRHTLLCCMEDTFTDCPGYEQTYWVGDGRNEALIAYMAFGEWDFVKRNTRLPAHSLVRSEVPESQVPSGWQNILPAWSLLWIQMVEEYYRYTGDADAVRELYPAIEKTLESFHRYCENDYGLLSMHAWNLFDWARTDTEHCLVTHNSMFLLEGYRRAAVLAGILGKEEDASRWNSLRTALTEQINSELWSEEGAGFVDSIHGDGVVSGMVSQQANTLAVLYDGASGDRMKMIEKYLTEPPAGMVVFGSPFATFFLLEALGKLEKYEEILEIIRSQWGFMLDAGATSFWETFPGYQEDVPTRSHCHAWSSAPTYFLSLYQLGVSPALPGFGKVLVQPRPCGLSWAEGTVPTPRGELRVSWRFSEEQFLMEVILPQGLPAEIVLPLSPAEYLPPEVHAIPGDETLLTRISGDGSYLVSSRNGGSVMIRSERKG